MAAGVCAYWTEVRLHHTDQDYRDHLSLSVRGDKLSGAGRIPRHRLSPSLAEMLRLFRCLRPFKTAKVEFL